MTWVGNILCMPTSETLEMKAVITVWTQFLNKMLLKSSLSEHLVQIFGHEPKKLKMKFHH